MTQYLDFKVILAPGPDGGLRVTAESSKGEKAYGTFEIPAQLGGAQVKAPHQARNIQVFEEDPGYTVSLSGQEQGELLFKALFRDDIGRLFEQCRTRPMRLKLVFEVPAKAADGPVMAAAHALPWELLYAHDFLAKDHHYSIVRQIDSRAPHLTDPPLRLKALMISANPGSTGVLDLKREAREIKRAVIFPRIKLDFLEEAGHLDLYRATEQGYQVLHFMGHGEGGKQESAIFLEDGKGNAEKLSPQSFVRVILGMKERHKPQLVVLNACEGGVAIAGREGLEGMAANLFRAGVPAVVGMREEIGDESAIAFSSAFYRRLALADTVDEAVLAGRKAIAAVSKSPTEWSLPALYSNLPQGRLTRQPRLLQTLIPVAAVLLLWWCWHGLRHRVILSDPSWAKGVLSRNLEDRYYAMLTARGLELGQFPIGREVRLVSQAADITGYVRYRLFFLTGPTHSFSVGRGAPKSGEDGTQASLVLTQRLAWRTLDTLGREAKDLEAGFQGLGFLEMDALVEAEERFRKALTLNPDFAEAHNNLAVLLWSQARFHEALVHARLAWKKAPEIAAFAYNLSRILIDNNEPAAALELLDTFASQQGHSGALNEMGKLLAAAQRWGDAMLAFQQCIDLDPNFAPALKNFARLHLDRGRPDLAEPLLHQARETVGADRDAEAVVIALQVRCFAALEQWQEACGAWADLAQMAGVAITTEGKAALEAARVAGCAVSRDQPQGSPLAFLLNCSGEVRLQAPGTGARQVEPRRIIFNGQSLKIGAQSWATLVTTEDYILELKGEFTWLADSSSGTLSGPMVPGFYASVSNRLDTMPGPLAGVVMVASRGDETLALLAPRGLAREQDDIAWTPVAGATAYRVTVREVFGPEETLEILPQIDSNGLCRITWPWAEWRPSRGSDLTIAVTAFSAAGISESGVGVKVMNEDRERRLDSTLAKLCGAIKDRATGAAARALAMRNFGLAGAQILMRYDCLRLDESPENGLALAMALIEGGLGKQAIDRLESLGAGHLTSAQKAQTEALLGLTYKHMGVTEEARAHMEKARALFIEIGETARAAALEF